MNDKPISPVIVTFKKMPDIRVMAMEDDYTEYHKLCIGKCRFAPCGGNDYLAACGTPNGGCGTDDFYWREVPQNDH